MEIPEPDHQFKVPVVRRLSHTLYLEQATRLHTFIHCDVHTRWTQSVKAALSRDFATLRTLHGGPLYALHQPGDAKHSKFLSMFGFKFAAAFKDKAGRRMEIHQVH